MTAAAGWPPDPAEDDTHLCPARGCRWQVPHDRLMCPGDWRRVPGPVQRAVWSTWDDGRGAGTRAHRAAVGAAIRAANRVRQREAERADAERLARGERAR